MSYSLHLGSDKNKRQSARNSAKTNKSGTTSLANNAIQNAKTLSKVAKHNQGKYEDNPRQIEVITGSDSLYEDVKKIYKQEFEEARISYTDKQTREDRKINDYFKKISDDSKSDLACEIIIELGDKQFWEKKSDDYRRKMTEVFKNQVKDLEMLVPEFKIASAIVHYDETSPHMHIVGVPIKENCKTGMSKQVGKGAVFTKESLRRLQDKMRTLCIDSFNKEYKDNKKLKRKMKGRNIDYLVSEMGNYQEKIKQVDKQRQKIEEIDKKTNTLDKISKTIKDKITNLKNTKLGKDKYIITEEDKKEILKYIEDVSNTNNDFKDIKELSIDLKDLNEDIKNDKEEIRELIQKNNALNVRLDNLTKQVKEKDERINTLKLRILDLENILDYFEDKFKKLIKFIRNKVFDRNKTIADEYDQVVTDMYEEDVLDKDEVEDIYNEKDYKKDKDDYDLSI